MSILEGARVVLCVSGSIAAYKGAELASKLTQAGSQVDTLLTKAATSFVAPLTFEALTARAVYSEAAPMTSEHAITHVRLGQDADVIVFAPATAAAVARLAQGLTDDLATATALASQAPLVIAPAMEPQMLSSAATQANLRTLQERGAHVVPAAEGRLASGRVGRGRLPEPEVLLDAIRLTLGRAGVLKGQTVVVSGGGTREYLDPVRFLGNPSSGKQGVALARAARDRGARVRLVLGTATVEPPYGVDVARVATADEMLVALREAVQGCDALIMNAAVGDYRPQERRETKLKRAGGAVRLELQPTPDLLGELPGDFIRIGFAAESHDHAANARAKLHAKELDAIALNDITKPDRGFGSDTNAVTLITADGLERDVALGSKDEVAEAVLDLVAELLAAG